jgi:hypothetical protein
MAAENILIEFNADVDGLKPAIDTLVKIGQITEKDAQEFDKVNKSYKDRIAATNALAASQAKVTGETASSAKSMDALAKSAKSVEATIVKGGTNEAIKKTNEEVKKYDNSLKGLKQQYKDLLSLAIANGEESPIGKQALKDAGELKDRIGDLSQATKNLGSDTRGFDAVGQGLSTIGSGFQAAIGAQALFGDGSEDLQKKMVQLQAVMALTNGLQQIQAALQKETALRQGLTAVSTRALGIATAGYNLVVGTSTGLMKAFRIALASTGIGLLVIGLVALIANFDKVSEAVKSFIGKLDFLKPGLEAASRGFEAFKQAIGLGDVLSKELELLEKWGIDVYNQSVASRERLFKLRQSQNQNTLGLEKLSNEQLLNAQKLLFAEQKKIFVEKAKEEGKISQESIDKLKASAESFANTTNDLNIRNNEIAEELQKQALEASLLNIQNKLKFTVRGGEEELKYKVAQAKAIYALEVSNINATTELSSLKNQKIQEANIKRIEAEKQASQDYFAFQLDLQKKEIDNKLLITNTGLEKELSLKLQALNIEKDIASNNYKLTVDEKVIIEEQFQNKRLELNKTYQDKINAELLKSINTQFDNAASEEKILQQKFDSQSQYLQDVAQIEANYTNNSFAKKIAIEQQFRKTQIDLAYNKFSQEQSLFNLELSRLDTQLANKLISEKEYQDARLKLENESSLRVGEINNEARKLELEDIKKTEAEKLDLLKQRADIIQQYANLATDTLKKANEIDLQGKLEAIKREQLANEENLKQGNINEKQFFANKEELRRKEQKAKVEAAKRDRQIKIVETIINTASAVVAALPNVALSILAGVTGAIQLAVINAQKIPEFAKGTKNAPKGWAWVGEQGPELISLRGGEEIKTHNESLQFAKNKFANNYNISKETNFNKVDNSPSINTDLLKISTTGISLDYEKLSKLIGGEVHNSISKLPITNFTMDKEGFSVAVSNGNSRINYLDNRYSSN